MLSWREAESAFGDVSASNAQPSSGRTNALTSGFALGFTRPHGSPGWHSASSSSELVARLTAPQASLAAASAPKSAPRCSPRRTRAPGLSLWWSRAADRRGRGALRRREGDVISRLQRWLGRRGENICEPPSPPSRRTRAPYPLSRPRRRGSTRRPSRGSAPTPPASRASSSEPPRRSHTSTTPAHRSRRNASSTRSSHDWGVEEDDGE